MPSSAENFFRRRSALHHLRTRPASSRAPDGSEPLEADCRRPPSQHTRGPVMNISRRIPLSRWTAALLCAVAFAFPAAAQSNKGTITGTVTDPNGAVVKDAKVTATNTATGEVREATTGDEGEYVLPALDPGLYRITVEAAGFSQSIVEEVKLDTASRQAI